MKIAIITDESEANALAESLRTNSPSPMSYSNSLKSSLPESILGEDSIVSAFPLIIKEVRVMNSDATFHK